MNISVLFENLTFILDQELEQKSYAPLNRRRVCNLVGTPMTPMPFAVADEMVKLVPPQGLDFNQYF